MRRTIKLAVSVAALAASALPLPSEALTLREAIETALNNNPGLKAAEYRKEAASEGVNQARAGFMPQVELSETYSRTNSPLNAFGTKLNQERITQRDFEPSRLNSPDEIDNWRTDISIRQPIYAGGAISSEYEKSAIGERAAGLALIQARRDVAYRVTEAWLSLGLLNEKARILELSKRLAEDGVKITKDRVEAGLAMESDLLDMKINYERAVRDINVLGSEIETMRSVIRSLIGATPEEKPGFEFGEFSFPKEERSLGELQDAALASRADIKRVKAEKDREKMEIRSARAGFLPSVGLAADYQWNSEKPAGYDGDSWLVAVEAKWNIFSGGRDKAKAKMAAARLNAIGFEERALVERARVEVETAFRKLASAAQTLEIAIRQERLAEESHRITKQQYLQGLKSASDLLKAEVQLEQARLGRSVSEHELLIAKAGLDHSLGLDETSIEEKF